jgi:aldehyde oxidoreductase
VQGHACLFAWLLKKPVMVHLDREESIRMHPKRHPVWMDISLAVDGKGKFMALRLKAFGDTGAYASVGTKVMERVVGHATGGYTVPAVDVQSLTVYTNNIPSGAMRGFGVPQVTFAIESCIDEVCRMGGFDRWQIRFDNALEDGAKTATGQVLRGVGLKKTLLAVEDDFRKAAFAGIACGLKNTGVGNGMIDDSEVILEVRDGNHVVIHHGWTEMGQGVHTMAIQTLHEETGLDPSIMEVVVDTSAGIPTGMTTSSRATALVSNAIIDAAKRLKADLGGVRLESPKADLGGAGRAGGKLGGVDRGGVGLDQLKGRRYKGKYVCDWTSKPGTDQEDPQIHFSYGYATQVVVLDELGKITRVIAAHDAGKIMNRMLFEGQIEGAVHMGLGYALTEDLPLRDGMPVSGRFKDLGILRATEMPEVTVIGVEEKDPVGPYGAKGIGEIGMVPTAAAVANAFYALDGMKRTRLPLRKNNGKK